MAREIQGDKLLFVARAVAQLAELAWSNLPRQLGALYRYRNGEDKRSQSPFWIINSLHDKLPVHRLWRALPVRMIVAHV
jgi:hypothetical protein